MQRRGPLHFLETGSQEVQPALLFFEHCFLNTLSSDFFFFPEVQNTGKVCGVWFLVLMLFNFLFDQVMSL